jgi:hypothetical protein
MNVRKGESILVVIPVLAACVLAVCVVSVLFLYTPMMDWLIKVAQLSPSILLCFVVAVILLIGCLVICIWYVRHKAPFWQWLMLLMFLLFFGGTSGLYGSFYFLAQSGDNGCITKDCVRID